MNIPGFTAEASLHETNSRYNANEESSNLRKSEGIVPQARILDGFCISHGKYCCFRGPDGKWSCGYTQSA